jgi:uncharacterized SAM-binding protein YcdF (DUF218 family)
MSLDPLAVALVVPPLNLLPVTAVGLALAWRGGRCGLWLAAAGLAALYVLALPIVGGSLIASLEHGLPLAPPPGDPPRAIVILSAEVSRDNADPPTFGVGPLTLERERAGAVLARRVGLPVLVTGGRVDHSPYSIADLMVASLAADFAIRVRWIEPQSADTWENAADTAAILKAQGIHSVYLVTHAWHMRRALLAFAHFGITATAAPVLMDRQPTGSVDDFVPRVNGWVMSYDGLHEWIGWLDYALLRR